MGLVLYDGGFQSFNNIRVSFIHHMFGYSYQFSTIVAVVIFVTTSTSALLTGYATSKIGRKMELLSFAGLCGIGGDVIYGWIHTHKLWAFCGAILKGGAVAVIWTMVFSAIPLIVSDKVKGTAFGLVLSVDFLLIGICYIITGTLTK